MNPQSQNAKIYNHLMKKRGKWCPMPELVRVSGSLNIHCRISNLRAAGIPVENRVDRTRNTMKKSYYRIKEGAA